MTDHVVERVPETGPERTARRPWRRRLPVVRVQADWRAGLRESAVILLSVSAALAGQAWWERREDRQRELGYLDELLADTRANEAMLDGALARDATYSQAGRKLMGLLLGSRPMPRGDTVLLWVSQSGSSSDYKPVTGTLRSLMGTGDLRLIHNDSLRALIAQYDGTLQADGQDIRSLVDLQIQQVVPLARAAPFLQGALSGPVHASPADLEALRRNGEYRAILMALQTANSNRLIALREIRRETRRLRHALEVEPGVRGQRARRQAAQAQGN